MHVTLGMIWANYYDAIREGDGHRIMQILKYLLVIFKKTGHNNYAKDVALHLLLFKFKFSDRVAEQVLTARFVNTRGIIGHNMPADLHLEHLNRRLKRIIRHLGSNIQPSTLTRAAKGIGIVDDICKVFGESLGNSESSDKHSKRSSHKDFQMVLQQLNESKVLEIVSSRGHNHVQVKQCLLETIDYGTVTEWLNNNIIPCIH